MCQIILDTIDDTTRLASWLGANLPLSGVEALYLFGPLGAGKTTLTQYLVHSLPGGDKAEVASPSFTVFHCYPTTPPVLHCDLYRCQNAVPDELLELLEAPQYLTIMEWPEFLPSAYRSRESLDICFKACEKSRRLELRADGTQASRLLRSMKTWWGTK